MKNNIVLVGFMGVGKGSLARELVKETSMFAIDTDDLIESLENRKVKEIFKEDGEPYFRALEQKCAIWLAQNVDNTIISVGGGFYKVDSLKEIGKIIYLHSGFEAILKKILDSPNYKKKLKKRPLFKSPKQAKKLYDLRVDEYKKVADKIINVEDKTTSKVLKEILEFVGKK